MLPCMITNTQTNRLTTIILPPKVEVSQGETTRINLEKQLLQLLQERETDKVLKERRTLINQLKLIVNKETHLTSLNMTVYQLLTLNFLQLQVHVYMIVIQINDSFFKLMCTCN